MTKGPKNPDRARKWTDLARRTVECYLRGCLAELAGERHRLQSIPFRRRSADDQSDLEQTRAYMAALTWAMPGGRGVGGELVDREPLYWLTLSPGEARTVQEYLRYRIGQLTRYIARLRQQFRSSQDASLIPLIAVQRQWIKGLRVYMPAVEEDTDGTPRKPR